LFLSLGRIPARVFKKHFAVFPPFKRRIPAVEKQFKAGPPLATLASG
jgi:hypothetical protein